MAETGVEHISTVRSNGLGRYAGALLGVGTNVWYAVLALTGLHFLITGWNLNLQHISSPDEPRYACAARHMMATGDYIIPYFNARPRLEKPVLFHWMLTISGHISTALGISLETMGFRFVPLLMGWVTVIALYLLTRRLLNARTAFIAAIVLMTSYDFHETSRELVVDMALTACIMLSWLFFHVACGRLERNEKAALPLLGMYLSLGCGCTTKGPFLLGIFFIVPTLVYLGWTGRLSLLKKAGLWWGVPLSVAIGFFWFFQVIRNGQDPSEFFAIENIARFFGQKDHVDSIPFYFYLRTMLEYFAPWVYMLPFVAVWTIKRLRQRRVSGLSDNAKLAACALGLGFMIIGISMSKRHLYLIPLFPFLSLWVGWYLERLCFGSEESANPLVANLLRASGVFVFLVALSSIFWLPLVGGLNQEIVTTIALGAFILAAGFAAGQALLNGNRAAAMGLMLVMPLTLMLSLEMVRRPMHERRLNLSGFYEGVREKLGDRRLVINGLNSNEASWYLEKTPGPIDQIKQSELKSCFFEAPNTAMLVSEAFFKKSQLLQTSVRKLSGPFLRYGDPCLLIEPDPDHPPDPALYKVHVQVKSTGNSDDL